MTLYSVAGGDDRPQRIGYLYDYVADEIEARITSGEFEVGTLLLNERQMSDVFSTSLGTARRAIEALRRRGLVVTFPSKGTFVVSRVRREPMPLEEAKLVCAVGR